MVLNQEKITPLITAIIPIDDAKNGLSKMLTWMSKSDLSSYQVIIVLDTDSIEVRQIVFDLRITLEDSQVQVIESKGRNPGTSRNTGLNLAIGKWVCFWDADDLPVPSEFIAMAAEGSSSEADLVIGDYSIVAKTGSGESETRINTQNPEQIYRNPGLWRILFRRDSITNIRFPEISMAEDQIFVFAAMSRVKNISFHNQIVYRYFKYESGQLTRNPQKFNDLKIALPMVSEELINDTQIRNLVKIRMARSCVRNGNLRTKIFGIRKYFPIKLRSVQTKFSENLNQQEKTSNKILVPMTGGLGNQLFQLAAACHFANGEVVEAITTIGKPRVQTDGSIEAASFTLPENVRVIDNLKENKFITKCFGYLLRSGNLPTTLEQNKLVRRGIRKAGEIVFSVYFKRSIQVRVASDVGFDDKLSISSGTTLLIGYFQSFKYVSDSFVNSIVLTDSSKKEHLDRIRVESLLRPPLVVHVRLSDYRNDSNLGVLEESYYKSNVTSQWETGEYKEIWLFSDEPKEAISRLPKELLIQTRIFLPEDWNTAETLVLMSMGHGYVLANSSYSWWAARLSRTANPRVVVPTPWFAGTVSPNKIIPMGWTSSPRDSR